MKEGVSQTTQANPSSPKYKLWMWIVAGVIVIGIIVGAIFMFSGGSSENEPSSSLNVAQTYIDACASEPGGDLAKEKCYARKAVLKPDLTFCDTANLQDPAFCYFIFGIELQDETFCSKVISKNSFVRDECYQSVASWKIDSTICTNIVDTDMKSSCTQDIEDYLARQ